MTDKGNPIDLRPSLDARYSHIDSRSFRQVKVENLVWDLDRVDLLRSCVDVIHASSTQNDNTKATNASGLKRFVKWVDKRGTKLNRDTIVSLLADYDGDRRVTVAFLQRMASEALNFTHDERQLLFAKPNEEVFDTWVIRSISRGSKRTADFLRLVFVGDCSMSCSQFAKRRSSRLQEVESDQSGRTQLVRSLCDVFRAAHTDKSWGHATFVAYFQKLCMFFVWVDREGRHLDRSTVVDHLQSYAQHLMMQWRAGANAKYMWRISDNVAVVLAKVLEVEPFEIKKTLVKPPFKDSGWTSKRPDQNRIKEFCRTLHAIIGALPSTIVSTSVVKPLKVDLGSCSKTLPDPIGGYTQHAIDPRVANIPLTTLRIWAELHRFIAVTGCNLSVVQQLTCGQWRSNRDGVLEELKRRAQKFVTLRACKLYARHIDAHIEFLHATLPVALNDDTLLFPMITSNAFTHRSLLAYSRAGNLDIQLRDFVPGDANLVHRWLKENGISNIGTRQLRQAKSSWLLRRYSGDSLRVAQALGNTPEVVHQHYGGKGNLEASVVEWKNFWSEGDNAVAIAPGNCVSPGQMETQSESSGACRDSACLGCRHYRGEDSIDYIHRMLSFQNCLCLRAISNQEVARSVAAIDRIIEEYVSRHQDSHEAVQQLRKSVKKNPHPDFAAMTKLIETFSAA